MKYVLDASVYVARHSPLEEHYDRAKELWRFGSSSQFYVPSIFPLEVVSAFSRASMRSEVLTSHLKTLTGAKFIALPVDDLLLNKAITVVRESKIRSADAIYLALSMSLNATFVTLDFKLKKHLSTSPNSVLRKCKILS